MNKIFSIELLHKKIYVLNVHVIVLNNIYKILYTLFYHPKLKCKKIRSYISYLDVSKKLVINVNKAYIVKTKKIIFKENQSSNSN